jgi:hypothetical protein
MRTVVPANDCCASIVVKPVPLSEMLTFSMIMLSALIRGDILFSGNRPSEEIS